MHRLLRPPIRARWVAWIVAAIPLTYLFTFGLRPSDVAVTPDGSATARALTKLQQSRTAFVPNRGQWEHQARYVLRSGPMTVFLEDRGWCLSMAEPAPANVGDVRRGRAGVEQRVRGAALRMTFEGQNKPELVPEGDEVERRSYFRGKSESRWLAGVPVYEAVRYRGLYPGVDVRMREVDGHPEYDLLLAPGADLTEVAVRVDGASALRIAEDGALAIETELGPVTQAPPRTWQVGSDGDQQQVECRYVVLAADRFGFEVAGWDVTLPLTIDPGLVWSTVISGMPGQGLLPIEPIDVHVDASGVVTIVGVTGEPTYPTTMGAFDVDINGLNDGFVAQLDARLSGSAQLVYSTFLGGTRGERAVAVDIGPAGLITVTGFTASTDFPTTTGAFDESANGRADVFLAQLDLTQTGAAQLVYSTLLGGSGLDQCSDVHVAQDGSITVVGDTDSALFPTTPDGFDLVYSGGTPQFPQDSFLVRLDPSQIGSAQLVYGTFFGGTGLEFSTALHVDDNGVATVGGETSSADFPFSTGAFNTTYAGNSDAFVFRLDPSQVGSAQLLYGTLFGGAELDLPWTLDVDRFGVVTIGGGTMSGDFPTTVGALDTMHGGKFSDGFVSQFDPTLTGSAQLVYSTFLGGASADSVFAVSVNVSGFVTVTGDTSSTDFPTTTGAYSQMFLGGLSDVFLLRLDPAITGPAQLHYSSFLGGSETATPGTGIDEAAGLFVNVIGVATVIGTTDSQDYPTTLGAFASAGSGGTEAFVTRVDMLPIGVSAYGGASAGCNGLLAASVNSIPQIGNTSFQIICNNAPPGGAGTLALSVAPLTPPVNVLGIDLFVDVAFSPYFLLTATSDGMGASRVRMPIPAIPSLRGSLFGQFLWLGPTSPAPCPPMGLSASNALQIEIQP